MSLMEEAPASHRQRVVRTAIRLLAVLTVTGGITVVCSRVVPVNATTAGFVFLLAVLVLATGWGLLEATGAFRTCEKPS